MSKETISEKSEEIRNEQERYANTRGRVADVIDDINDTKLDRVDLDSAITQERNERIDADNLKVDKTNNTIDAPNDDYKWTYIFNDNNTPSRMLAGSMGRNIANSYLTSVTNAGINLSAIWKIKTNGLPMLIEDLGDRSNDATYADFIGKNKEGQLAKVGYQAFLSNFNTFSADQSLRLSHLLNGGIGSAGAISVNLISPPVVQNTRDRSDYILLRGANLFLNSQQMKVEILASDKTTVIATIPNNQVQLDSGGTTLLFFYNFKGFVSGDCFIRLTSGSKSYTTSLSLKVVADIQNIDLNNVTWEGVFRNEVNNTNEDSLKGGIVSINSQIINGDANYDLYKSYKSSQLFSAEDDFLIEIDLSFVRKYLRAGTGFISSYIGICDSASPNILSPISISYLNWSWATAYDYFLLRENGKVATLADQPDASANITFIKNKNSLTMITYTSQFNRVNLNVKTVEVSKGFSLVFQNTSRQEKTTNSGIIRRAYKF